MIGRIVKLLLLTGQRRDEVGDMRWIEVDFDRAVWTIPSTRSKNHREHVVPLARAAITLFPHRVEGSTSLGTARAERATPIVATLVGPNPRPRSMYEFTRPVRKRQVLGKKRNLCPLGVCMIFGARPPQ